MSYAGCRCRNSVFAVSSVEEIRSHHTSFPPNTRYSALYTHTHRQTLSVSLGGKAHLALFSNTHVTKQESNTTTTAQQSHAEFIVASLALTISRVAFILITLSQLRLSHCCRYFYTHTTTRTIVKNTMFLTQQCTLMYIHFIFLRFFEKTIYYRFYLKNNYCLK